MRLLIVAAPFLAGAASAFAAGPESSVTRGDDAPPAPMDMVWGATDTNGVPLNSQWGLQVTEPGSLPDAAEICFSVPGYFDNPLCSAQHPPQDTGTRFTGLVCEIGSETPIAGHVNWYPSTVEGPIYWDSLSFFDRDYNVRVVPPSQNGLTVHNPENIKGEFDSRETINTFSTPWWTVFREASDAVALPPPSARGMVHGELHLRWTGGTLETPGEPSPDAPAAPPAPAKWARQGGEGEALLEELAARLSPEKRRALEGERPSGPFDSMPVRLQRATEADEADASATVSVTSRPDPAHAAAEERRLKDLLDAFDGDVPGPIGQALEKRTRRP